MRPRRSRITRLRPGSPDSQSFQASRCHEADVVDVRQADEVRGDLAGRIEALVLRQRARRRHRERGDAVGDQRIDLAAQIVEAAIRERRRRSRSDHVEGQQPPTRAQGPVPLDAARIDEDGGDRRADRQRFAAPVVDGAARRRHGRADRARVALALQEAALVLALQQHHAPQTASTSNAGRRRRCRPASARVPRAVRALHGRGSGGGGGRRRPPAALHQARVARLGHAHGQRFARQRLDAVVGREGAALEQQRAALRARASRSERRDSDSCTARGCGADASTTSSAETKIANPRTNATRVAGRSQPAREPRGDAGHRDPRPG